MDTHTSAKGQHAFYRKVGKRLLDLVLALLLALPALLLISLCYLAIKCETRGPAFFTQKRPGYRGRIFSIVKLRTMIVETHRNGNPLSDMERMTKTGRIIRALSLDELPQILCILRGEMSFIGPRPLLPEYLPLYTKEQMRRHDVLPGISGWSQVSGRNALSWEEKFAHDVYYVDHISLFLDLKIVWTTIVNVVGRKGINASEQNTMQMFTGSKAESTTEESA